MCWICNALTRADAQADAGAHAALDLIFRPKARAQQTVSVKPQQPLRITDVGLASGYVLGIASIDEEHRKATGVEELEDREPFHREDRPRPFLRPQADAIRDGFLDRFILDAGSLYSSRLFSSSGGFTKR
jgi:hypothetical protein